MSHIPRFILASGSPRRRELIASLGIPFEVVKSDVDETQHPGEPPYEYVKRLSIEKAEAVAGQVTASPAVVLAADTIVVLAADTIGVDAQGEILGKPVDADDARQMLRRLRGRDHIVCTAVTVDKIGAQHAAPLRQTLTELTYTTVMMRDYADNEIEAYIASGDPFDKAGSYAIQHAGFHPVARIDGCYTNVVGLPLCAVRRALAGIGWPDITAPDGCDCPIFVPANQST